MIVQHITETTAASVTLDGNKHIQLPEHDIRRVMMLALSVRNDLMAKKRVALNGSLQLPMEKLNFIINELDSILDQKEIDEYRISSYTFIVSKRQLRFGDETQPLTQIEADLLHFFCVNKDQIINRDDILTEIWGTADFYTGRSLDVYIHRLRKYFQLDSNIHIETIHRKGYRFSVEKNETLSIMKP
jgi:DNA-binding response OmpR family regulator